MHSSIYNRSIVYLTGMRTLAISCKVTEFMAFVALDVLLALISTFWALPGDMAFLVAVVALG